MDDLKQGLRVYCSVQVYNRRKRDTICTGIEDGGLAIRWHRAHSERTLSGMCQDSWQHIPACSHDPLLNF